ncbi:WD40-repeat-containing domain protein [Microdochium bolleyi]|uniref:ASTRA-associated protein 1 n=1 Tax=Microdochium bolleyi TaxID=196109 RepID=A0A136IW53_9PEZI|nr:WD40-repeat-containing domain protein [Microdochium bolleyi]
MSHPSQPPTPKSVLRGHESQVHAAAFVRNNQRLATGDADGFVVLWDLATRRPRAVWRAHTSAILGIASWGCDRLITHGRDHRLVVWKVTEEDEAGLSVALPLDKGVSPRPEPWVLHILNVNTMNFCAFASCPAEADGELLVAVPNTLASESVDIYHLPSQVRQHTIHLTDQSQQKTGMAMAMALLMIDGALNLIVGYENGMTVVTRQLLHGSWDVTYNVQKHSQPILSLDVSPSHDYFLTSGADALIVKHPIPGWKPSTNQNNVTPNARLGGDPDQFKETGTSKLNSGGSLLSTALHAQKASSSSQTAPAVEKVTAPLKVLNTKHSGQQSLRIRSDGKIFATAGWDSKVRVYSGKTMAELAVLKWHDVGCYATAFASVMDTAVGTSSASVVAEATTTEVLSVKERRIKHAKETHWLAAGSKDGKISLWDIY